jgi:putative flippase GtrA
MTAVVIDAPLGLTRQFARFSAVGIASTAVHLTLFSGLTTVLGALGANVGAALLTAVANTAVNRRFTFGVRGPAGAGRQHLQGLLFVALGLALTSGALALLDAVTTPSQLAELTVVVAANIVGALSRFALLRSWVFRV